MNNRKIKLDPYEMEVAKFLHRLGCDNLILGRYYFCHDNNRLQLPVYNKDHQNKQVVIEVRDNIHKTKRRYFLYYFFVDDGNVRALTEIKVSTDTEIDLFDTPTLSKLEAEIMKFAESTKKRWHFNFSLLKLSSQI